MDWKRIGWILAVCLIGTVVISRVPSDRAYLEEQAQLKGLKTILSTWSVKPNKGAHHDGMKGWWKKATGEKSNAKKRPTLFVRCQPGPCSRSLLWEIRQKTPFLPTTKTPPTTDDEFAPPPRVRAATSKPATGPASQASTRQATKRIPQAQNIAKKTSKRKVVALLLLQWSVTDGRPTGLFGRMWHWIRPHQGHLTLDARMTALGKPSLADWVGKSKKPVVAWSAVLPPLLAIFFVLLTRQLILSLFLSLFFGVMLLVDGNVVQALYHTSYTYVWKKGISTEFSFNIIVFSLSLLGMVNVCSRNGGVQGLIEGLRKYASTARSSRFVTMLLGLCIFFDDYANSIVVGNTMRPLTDRYRVSREKLAYLIDSTAAPIAGIALLSTWIGYEVGLLGDLVTSLGLSSQTNGYSLFLSSLPFRFYCWMTLLFVFLGIFLNRDFGPMLKAERRAWEDGKLLREGAKPLVQLEGHDIEPNPGTPARWYNAGIPVLLVIVVGFVGLLYSGGALEGKSLQDALSSANNTRVFLAASLIGSVVAIGMSVAQGLLTIGESIRAWFAGGRAILFAVGILIFAWSMGALSKDLGTSYYLIALLKSSLSPTWVPLLVFLMAALISFATGTSWGTMGILLPTAAPLAYAIGGLPVLVLSVGAVLDGSIFGDHCSPLSDTTLFSSAAAACDHVDHVKTQAPYAIVVMLVASTLGYLAVASGMAWGWSVVGSLALFSLIFFLLGKPTNPPRVEVSSDPSA